MTETVGDFLVQRLAEWGVRRIYGYSGDGINGLLAALRRAEGRVELVTARHEEMAALMACGHAKFTGEVGVCLATSGPGAIHLLNGLYDAQMDHQPVVAIVGQQARMALGSSYQQDIDLVSLFKDVARAYVQMVTSPEQVRHVVDVALRTALVERTVTCVIVPKDVQDAAMQQPERTHGATFSGTAFAPPRVLPQEAELRRAAEVLNAGERVAMLVGAGALQATEPVLAVAEALGAGIAKALLGKAAVPDDLPFVTGAIGMLGTRASTDMMLGCDTLLMVGSSFPYAEYLPKEGQARAVQIDLDGRRLGLRYPVEVGLHGESDATLRALLPLLAPKRDRSWRATIEESVRDWWQTLAERADHEASPLSPQKVAWELSPRLPERCIVTADSGTAAVWFARDLKLRRGMQASVSGALATMGSAVPYALAAKLAHPDRPVIALVGDGAMQMNGNSELVTVADRWRAWKDPRLIVLVLNNRDLNFVTWEMRLLAGDPKFDVSQAVPDFPYARYAELIGLKGIRVDAPDQVAPAWEAALAADRPVVIEAVVDPSVPVLPPLLTSEQEKQLFAALKRDSDGAAARHQVKKELRDGGVRRGG